MAESTEAPEVHKISPEDQLAGLRPDLLWKIDLASFAERASGGKWKPYNYLVYIAEKIQEIILEGKSTGRQQYIILEAPVRHGKSWLVDYWLPTWYLENFPENRVMLGAYNDDFAATWGRKVLDEFNKNDLMTATVNPDKSAASDFLMTAGGGMRTFGVNSSVTGFGADLLIVDDPVKNIEEAYSETYRDKLYMQFYGDIFTRLEPGGTLILMMARRHEDDLIGRIKEDVEKGNKKTRDVEIVPEVNWHQIRLPALAEANDLLGRKEGEALCPERYPREILLAMKSKLPAELWNGLYQQRPSAMQGNLFQRKHWRHWDARIIPKKFDDTLISVDTNVEEGSDNDYTVIQAWGKKGANFYLLDQVRFIGSMTSQMQNLKTFCAKFPWIQRKLIEKKANGPAIQNVLKKAVSGIVLVEPIGSKYERALAAEPSVTSECVYLPEDDAAYPWVEDFKDEAANFPKAKHDDQVDTFTQAINHWNGYNTEWLTRLLSQ